MEEKINEGKETGEINKVDKFLSDVTDAVKKRTASLKTQAYIVYGLYLLSFAFGISAIIGVVVAYIAREKAKKENMKFLVDNFTWQIKTFWGLLILVVIGIITMFTVVFPSIVIGVGVIWFVYRIIKGIICLSFEKTIY